jgi:hypothetical protein
VQPGAAGCKSPANRLQTGARGCTADRSRITAPPSVSGAVREQVDPETAADEIAADWTCYDCGADTLSEYYMVWDEVWTKAGARDEFGFLLCVGCLERRLGRRLGAEDFTDALINSPRYSWRDSPRLAARKRTRRFVQLVLAL